LHAQRLQLDAGMPRRVTPRSNNAEGFPNFLKPVFSYESCTGSPVHSSHFERKDYADDFRHHDTRRHERFSP